MTTDLALGVIGGPQGPKALLDAVRDAVKDGNLDTLERLSRGFLAVDENASKCVDENGNTLCHLALGKNSITLQFVIEALHSDVNAPNNQGRTALHEAVTHNYVECCHTLLDHGADDNVQSATLSTPFHTAAACGSVECLEALVAHSENPQDLVNRLDRNHSSALHKCAFDGDVRVSQWLVDHGCAVDVADSTGVTPLLVAVKMGQKAVAEFLLKNGADVNKQDSTGNTPLHFCAIRCDPGILQLLLSHGALPNAQNHEYNTALHLAAIHQRPDSKEWESLVALLLSVGCDPSHENASKKKAADYVGRSLKKLFTTDEVARRRELEESARRVQEEDLAAAIALRTTWQQKVHTDITKRREREQQELDRLAKEAAEQTRAENDAMAHFEEVIVTIQYLESEIEKRKAMAEKAKK